MARELTLRIIVEQPPTGVDFALQKGTGSAYETVQKQRSEGNDLAFEFTPSIKDGVSDSMAASRRSVCAGADAAAIRLYRYRDVRGSGRFLLESQTEDTPSRDRDEDDRGGRCARSARSRHGPGRWSQLRHCKRL
jgi:Family of unknown function (DUF5990)